MTFVVVILQMMKSLLPVTIFLLIINSLQAQIEYAFNNPGSFCYFRYVSYAPDGDYQQLKRPFIFIIGPKGIEAQDLFENDTLKSAPIFHHYYFVYVPNLHFPLILTTTFRSKLTTRFPF